MIVVTPCRSVRPRLAHELHARAAHAHAPVAVEDRDHELRRLADGSCRCGLGFGFGFGLGFGCVVRRWRGLLVPAAAAGEQRDESRDDEDARDHACSPTASSR